MDNVAISLRGLTKRFGDLVAVDSVDLEIARGELFGLLGPNGAGKTTIIKMLTTMLKPTDGEALVWGHNVVTEKDAVRSSVGVVFQDPSVDSMLTGRENLDFHGRMYGLDRAMRKKRIAEVLELVDLTDKADVKLEGYSGGMQRRLEIARGLMHHPRVLFLDEPTLGLDAQTRRYIWQYVKEMNRQEGVTVVLTTHYMDEADFLCNRVAIIDNGKIVALDTPKNLKDMIGADTITLETQKGGETLLASLKDFDWIKSNHQSNGSIELMVDHAESRIPEIMLTACRNDVVIRSVGLHEPTLEDVFLKYTGKKIREAESANQGKMNAIRIWHRRK
jgi:ABC-2 type transport system ATP-binding protein